MLHLVVLMKNNDNMFVNNWKSTVHLIRLLWYGSLRSYANWLHLKRFVPIHPFRVCSYALACRRHGVPLFLSGICGIFPFRYFASWNICSFFSDTAKLIAVIITISSKSIFGHFLWIAFSAWTIWGSAVLISAGKPMAIVKRFENADNGKGVS